MGNTVNVTTANFDVEVMRAAEPVVIDFWAPWCGPCRMIGPVLEDLAARYAGQVKVAKINVDEQPQLANVFKVQGIPTLYVLHGGNVIDRVVGFGGKAALEGLFADLAQKAVSATH
ncbi:MAG: thioredoxin [Myxococcales bacterium]|nr:thioredoxin [Myxococcales bacterium]